MRAFIPFLLITPGCATTVPRKNTHVISAVEPASELSLDSASALTAKLTYSAVQVRAIGANIRHFIRDVRFTKDALNLIAYEISESPGGSSLKRTEWLLPYSSLRKSTFEIRGQETARNRYGELHIIAEKKDAFRHFTELSTALVPLGRPGPHLKLSRDVGAKSQLTLMFFSQGRAEDFRDALIAALNNQTPNKAPEPTTLAVTPRALVLSMSSASFASARVAPATVVAHL